MSEQEKRESPKAYAAFRAYCALGNGRSLAKMTEVYQEYAKGLPLLKRWSVQHNWQERLKVYDAERLEERRHKRDEAIEQMNERMALIGREHQEKAVKQIEALIAAKKFGSQAAVQLLKLATDLERLAMGAPTERSEQTGPDGEPLNGPQVVFYLPKVEQKEGYDG